RPFLLPPPAPPNEKAPGPAYLAPPRGLISWGRADRRAPRPRRLLARDRQDLHQLDEDREEVVEEMERRHDVLILREVVDDHGGVIQHVAGEEDHAEDEIHEVERAR